MIFNLSPDLIKSVLLEWSDLEAVTRLDTSVSNAEYRNAFLLNLPQCTTQLNPMTKGSLEYMHIHGMRFNSVSIKSRKGFDDFVSFLNEVEYEQVQHLHLLSCKETNISLPINLCKNLSSLEVKVRCPEKIDTDDWQLINPEIMKNLHILKCNIIDIDDEEAWENMWKVTFQRCESLNTLIIITYYCYVLQNSTWNQLFINNKRTLKVLNHCRRQRDSDEKATALSANDQREFLQMVIQCELLESFRWFFYFITLPDILPLFGSNNLWEHLNIETYFHNFNFSCFKLSIVSDESAYEDGEFDFGDVVVYEDELLALFQLPKAMVLSEVRIVGCYFSNRILELLPSGLVKLTIRGLSQATTDGFENLIYRCKRLSFLSLKNTRYVDGKQLQDMLSLTENNCLKIKLS